MLRSSSRFLRSAVSCPTTSANCRSSKSLGPGTALRAISSTNPNPEGITKKEIVGEIAKAHDLTVAKSGRILDTVLDTIVESVAEGKSVKLSKFGTFQSFRVEARTGRNPSTGAPLQIPAKNRIRFKPYQSFKAIANDEQ